MKVSISIFINSEEDSLNYFNYNKSVDIEDFEILIKDICDGINRGAVRKKLKSLGEDSLEE